MDVYVARRLGEEQAPLFRELDGELFLEVFLSRDDAQRAADRMDEAGFAAKIDSATVAQRGRETGREKVMLVLEEDEEYLTSVDHFEEVVANVEKIKMPQEEPTSASSQLVEPEATFKEETGFAASRVHAVLAFLATRRWPRFFGYGMLIVACRIVRTIIRA